MKPKLLLADDSVTIRKVVELTFADEGIDVTTAPDGDTAMQKFVEIQPDIVLVDVGLPGTSGYQICEMIKQDEGTQHIPVLLLVGSFEPFDHDEAERINADGFLTKPFHSIRDLVSRVWDLLGREEGNADESDEISPDLVTETETETETESSVSTAADSNADEVDTLSFEGADAVSASNEPINDIEQLYQSSLATVGEAKDFDPVDEIFIDSSMDDELIETFHPGSGRTTGEFERPGEAPEYVDPDPAEEIDTAQTKEFEFDWSPNGMVSKSEPEEPETQGAKSPAEDDEPELYQVADEPEPDGSEAGGNEAASTDFDWSSRSIVGETPEPSFEVAHIDDAEAASEAALEGAGPQDLAHGDESTGTLANERAELIELIAQRVIEKLSDNVIRDVAKEAVPRIAEKLIREALEDEKNR